MPPGSGQAFRVAGGFGRDPSGSSLENEENLNAVAEELRTRARREATMAEELRMLGEEGAPPAPQVRDMGVPPGLVDTRLLGKPDHFVGEEGKWSDWKITFDAYVVSVVNAEIARGMALA